MGDGLLLFYPHASTKWDQYKFGYGWHLWRIFSCHLTVRYGESAKEYIWGRPSIGREHHGIHGSDVQPVAVLGCCYVGTKIENLVGFDIVWLHSKMHFLSNYIITCNLTAKERGRDYDLSEYAIFGCWFPICHIYIDTAYIWYHMMSIAFRYHIYFEEWAQLFFFAKEGHQADDWRTIQL